jgi:hypothetical protein
MLHEIGTKDRIPQYIERVKAGEFRLMGFGHRVYKNYDPRARSCARWRSRSSTDRQQPAARRRARAGADQPRGRLLRLAQAVPERRLLLRHHLPGDGLPRRHVPRPVRDPADRRLAGAVGGDAARLRAEDRAAAAGLHEAEDAGAVDARGEPLHDPLRAAPRQRRRRADVELSSTRVDDVFTCWPPGPPERVAGTSAPRAGWPARR